MGPVKNDVAWRMAWTVAASMALAMLLPLCSTVHAQDKSQPTAALAPIGPTVSMMVSPASSPNYVAPASIDVSVNAFDNNGGYVTKIDLYKNNVLVTTVDGESLSTTLTNLAAGSYTIRAQATNDVGNTGSKSQSITITAPTTQPPTVSFATDSTSYVAPATVTLTATAADSDGSVSKVEFYNGATKLGEDTTAPYSFVWNNVAGSASAYALRARAIDNLGASTDSATINITVNALPTASLTAPANGSSYTAPASITLTANASDADGGVSKVEFYNGGTKLGEDTTAPYSLVWSNVAGSASAYGVKARAIDNRGATVDSAVASITVNALPSVSITAPAQSQVFQVGANVAISATASDADGSVQRVEFLVDGAKVGEDTTSPYNYTWASVEGGHALTAKAVDNRGAVRTSTAINVTINGKPSITLTSPANGAVVEPPAILQIKASASDYDGVSSVEFFADGVSVNTDTTSPYEYAWSSAAPGTHSVYAVVRDTLGGSNTSATATATVTKVIGNIDGLSRDDNDNYSLWGWACSTGLNPSISVHLYAGGAYGTGTFAVGGTANQTSEPGVAAACSNSGTNYRFSIPISTAIRQQNAGKAIYVHGISPVGGSNLLIGGSGQFQIPALPLSLPPPPVAAYSRTETIAYYDNTAKWVLGQMASVTCTASVPASAACDGDVVSSATFDPVTAQQLTSSSFGKLQQTLTYNTDGTVATVEDGNHNVTTLTNWKRGIPQNIAYTDGASESAVVNDNGWIESVTDENGAGFTTNYAYDAMGRLTRIVYPTGDTTTWNDTTLVFEPVASAEYGIAAGHWRQTITTGNGRKITYFDALWRPILVHEYDNADMAGTLRTTGFAYDAEGRVTFAAYPVTTTAMGTTGTWTEYDALGRVTSVSQDSELDLLTTTTEYLAGFQTRITPPRGQGQGTALQTTTRYMAYDQPTTDWSVAISHPEGAITEITRDAFGKPTAIARRNSDSSVALTRTYAYYGSQELCKTEEPETGATLMGYDAAGNLKWSSAGLTVGTPCDPSGTTAAIAARRVDRTYDARNRVTFMAMPDNRGNQSWTYTPDGLVNSTIVDNDGPSAGSVDQSYTYNKRRLLVGESSSQRGWYTWSLGYGYDANGHLASQSYPTGLVVTYSPNALGQPTRVQGGGGTYYASGVSYYPNGAIKQFTYGNGIVHSMAQNARQLPLRSTDGSVSVLEYNYDANANVTAIWDIARGGDYNRVMTYDGLDRLTSAQAGIFGGSDWKHRFTYDVLDNLKSWKLAGVKDYADYVYDASNRLVNIKNSANATIVGLGYDVQGNLLNKNGQGYSFDYGNRLREVTNKEAYRYDGHGRRVLSWRPADNSATLSFYGQAGQLLYGEDTRSVNTERIYLGGSLLANRETNRATGALAVKYQHTDALGSPVAVTGATGVVVERTDWEPYGAAIGKPAYDGIGYTGHFMDGATGLTYMQQRYYDPQIGRFLSIDPVTAYSNPVGAFNRYKYANNNPYRFTDPDGRYEEDVHRDLTAVLAQAAGAPQNIAAQIAAGDQGVDDNPATSPMGMSAFGEAVQVRADYHFTSSDRREQMYQDFKKSGNPSDMGTYLHAHQDSYSHDGYGARVGHLYAGHAPDKTYNDVAKADRMARTTYNTILNSRGAFKVGGQTVSFGKAVPWRTIAPMVHDFNAARTDADKQKALDAIRKVFE